MNHRGTENTEKKQRQICLCFFSVFSVPLWFSVRILASSPIEDLP
jgi:hypothetical protein